MKDEQCVRFLQWALPQLHMRWPGFRKVRKQVCKRVSARMRDLSLTDIDGYKVYLQDHTDEWVELDALCRITISRFYRDQGVFAILQQQVLPALARHRPSYRLASPVCRTKWNTGKPWHPRSPKR